MVRRAENATVVHQRGLFTGRGWLTLTIGKQVIRVAKIHANQFSAISQEQERVPVSLARLGERNYWWFRRRVYFDIDDLTQSQVYAASCHPPRA